MILHIAKKEDWKKAQVSGFYEAPSLQAEGFIHASHPWQILNVAIRKFKGQKDLVLLIIDTYKMKVEIKEENLEGGKDLFPHIYGKLDISTVMAAFDFPPHADGSFDMPDIFSAKGTIAIAC